MKAYAKWDAIIRFHYREDPERLSLEQWAKLVEEYRYVRYVESEVFKSDLKEVLYELAGKIYGKQ